MNRVTLRAWREGDLPLLVAANSPAMTAHLGGPEAADAVVARHEKYLRLVRDPAYGVQAIELDGVAAGGVNWWPSEWEGAPVTEMGWFVVPDAQGRGVAAAAVDLAIADARVRAEHRTLLACPDVDNEVSSRLCAASGFTLQGTADLSYRDTVLHIGIWTQPLDDPSSVAR